jgi:hypothetical protein
MSAPRGEVFDEDVVEFVPLGRRELVLGSNRVRFASIGFIVNFDDRLLDCMLIIDVCGDASSIMDSLRSFTKEGGAPEWKGRANELRLCGLGGGEGADGSAVGEGDSRSCVELDACFSGVDNELVDLAKSFWP